jgi:hypothetical protein
MYSLEKRWFEWDRALALPQKMPKYSNCCTGGLYCQNLEPFNIEQWAVTVDKSDGTFHGMLHQNKNRMENLKIGAYTLLRNRF